MPTPPVTPIRQRASRSSSDLTQTPIHDLLLSGNQTRRERSGSANAYPSSRRPGMNIPNPVIEEGEHQAAGAEETNGESQENNSRRINQSNSNVTERSQAGDTVAETTQFNHSVRRGIEDSNATTRQRSLSIDQSAASVSSSFRDAAFSTPRATPDVEVQSIDERSDTAITSPASSSVRGTRREAVMRTLAQGDRAAQPDQAASSVGQESSNNRETSSLFRETESESMEPRDTAAHSVRSSSAVNEDRAVDIDSRAGAQESHDRNGQTVSSEPDSCGICRSTLGHRDLVKFDCIHKFHQNCSLNWHRHIEQRAREGVVIHQKCELCRLLIVNVYLFEDDENVRLEPIRMSLTEWLNSGNEARERAATTVEVEGQGQQDAPTVRPRSEQEEPQVVDSRSRTPMSISEVDFQPIPPAGPVRNSYNVRLPAVDANGDVWITEGVGEAQIRWKAIAYIKLPRGAFWILWERPGAVEGTTIARMDRASDCRLEFNLYMQCPHKVELVKATTTVEDRPEDLKIRNIFTPTRRVQNPKIRSHTVIWASFSNASEFGNRYYMRSDFVKRFGVSIDTYLDDCRNVVGQGIPPVPQVFRTYRRVAPVIRNVQRGTSQAEENIAGPIGSDQGVRSREQLRALQQVRLDELDREAASIRLQLARPGPAVDEEEEL